jgi:hypothetical protein
MKGLSSDNFIIRDNAKTNNNTNILSKSNINNNHNIDFKRDDTSVVPIVKRDFFGRAIVG